MHPVSQPYRPGQPVITLRGANGPIIIQPRPVFITSVPQGSTAAQPQRMLAPIRPQHIVPQAHHVPQAQPVPKIAPRSRPGQPPIFAAKPSAEASTSQAQPTMVQPKPLPPLREGEQEFVVRVPVLSRNLTLSALKFNPNLKIDVKDWKNVRLDREDNSATVGFQPDLALKDSFGAGSEYNAANKKLARIKRYSSLDPRWQLKAYSADAQPFILTDFDRESKQWRGTREGTISENVEFWIMQNDPTTGAFEAMPVDQFYNFIPTIRHKTFDAEEAEEKFEQRAKHLNRFALRIEGSSKAAQETGESAVVSSHLRIRDDGGVVEDEDKEEGEDGDAPPVEKDNTKPKKKFGQHKKRRMGEKEGDDVASEDSDDGDDEGKEVDYMSDSEEDQEDKEDALTTEQATEALTEALVGVDQEGEESEEEEEEQENEEEEVKDAEDVPTTSKEADKADEAEKSSSDGGSGSDSDDPDMKDNKRWEFLLQGGAAAKSGEEKRKADASSSAEPPSKKAKKDDQTAGPAVSSKEKGITKQEVRRYLLRKPHSSKDLLNIFSRRVKGLDRNDIVQRLADILKQLNPDKQRRKDPKTKNETTYFSLKQT